MIDTPQGFDRKDLLLEVNSFRHDLLKANSSQDIWYYLVLAASCLYFGDVFLRRVQVSFDWVPHVARRLFGRKAAPARPADDRTSAKPQGGGDEPDRAASFLRPLRRPKEALGDISVIEPADALGSERPAAAPPSPKAAVPKRILPGY